MSKFISLVSLLCMSNKQVRLLSNDVKEFDVSIIILLILHHLMQYIRVGFTKRYRLKFVLIKVDEVICKQLCDV